MAKVCDWGSEGSSRLAVDTAIGRVGSCFRVYTETWQPNSLGGNLPTSGNPTGIMKICADAGVRILLSLRTCQIADRTHEDQWLGNGTLGVTNVQLLRGTDPINGSGDRDGNGPNGNDGVFQLADGLANVMRYQPFPSIDFVLDHEADLWTNSNTTPHKVGKGPPVDYPPAYVHIILKVKQRWAQQHTAGVISDATYNRLIGATTRPDDGTEYFRWVAGSFAFAGFNRGYTYPGMMHGGGVKLEDYLGPGGYIGIDIYSSNRNTRGTVSGDQIGPRDSLIANKQGLTFQDNLLGDYISYSTDQQGQPIFTSVRATRAENLAQSAWALCELTGLDFGMWEVGCCRDRGGQKANATKAAQDEQGTFYDDLASWLTSLGTGDPHCVVFSLFDPNTSGHEWGFPLPQSVNGQSGFDRATPPATTANWNNMCDESQHAGKAMIAMAALDYFGGDTVVVPPPPTAVGPHWGMLGAVTTVSELAVTDWGMSSGGFTFESDIGRPFGANREYIGGWEGTNGYNPLRCLPTSGAFTAGANPGAAQRSRYAKAIADGTRMCLSLRCGTHDLSGDVGQVQDSYIGNGDIVTLRQSCSGKVILNGTDPINDTGDRDGSDLNYLADMLANFTAQGGIWDLCFDHEADLWVDRGADKGAQRYSWADKGQPADYPPAVAHMIYKIQQRWAAQHTATVISDATYNKLTGVTLTDGTEGGAVAGKKFARFTTAYAFPAFNYIMFPDLWVGHGTDLSDWLDYIGADIYSEKANRGFATGDLALPFRDDFEGNYTDSGRTVPQHQAGSLNALCISTGLPYGIWEAGCLRANTSAHYQDQADYLQGVVDYITGQGTANPHCEVWTGFYSFASDWPYPTPNVRKLSGTLISARDGTDALVDETAPWLTLNAKSRATWDVIYAMANRRYFGGAS